MNGHKYPREWEVVNSTLQRLRLPDGWLLRSGTVHIIGAREVYASEDMLFQPDPEYKWQLENK